MKAFAGVDGEGGNINGKHEYLILRAGEYLLETGEPLTPYDCFAFLSDLPRNVVYVSFAFDYDVTMMIRSLPPGKVKRLFDRQSRAIRDENGKETGRYYPVEVGHGEWFIDYTPHKEFKVKRPGKPFIVISDVFTFFQSSFVKALRKWYGWEDENKVWHPNDDEEWAGPIIDAIAEGKEMRHDFGEVTEHEREYNEVECIMLAALMEKFRNLCLDLDIKPQRWQGPGNLVSAVFKREGMPKKDMLNISAETWNDANKAYYGGRFEVAQYGSIQEKVYQYDINSAYASCYNELPCLLHGTWREIQSLPDDESVLYFADISFNHISSAPWFVFPVRSRKGTLLFPRTARGWYWSNEINIGREYCELTFHKGWRYEQNCDCKPFDWVYRLYDQRDHYGKTSARGKVLKIVLATIYGKLAQSKGNPIYSNPFWSGYIVSNCRAKLVKAALQVDRGSGVLMLATDGLFTTKPIPELRISKKLGDWELTEHGNIFIVQSGVYFIPGDKPKTRGIPQSKVVEHEQDFRDVWRKWCELDNVEEKEPGVTIALRLFIGSRLAYARGKLWQAGRWIDGEETLRKNERDGKNRKDGIKIVRFNWYTKRCNQKFYEGDWSTERLVTDPIEGSEFLVSEPPLMMIGGELEEEKLVFDAQPDWGDSIDMDEIGEEHRPAKVDFDNQ